MSGKKLFSVNYVLANSLIYFGLINFSLLFRSEELKLSTFWTPNGALACVLIVNKQTFLTITSTCVLSFFINTFSNFWYGLPFLTSLGLSFANIVECVIMSTCFRVLWHKAEELEKNKHETMISFPSNSEEAISSFSRLHFVPILLVSSILGPAAASFMGAVVITTSFPQVPFWWVVVAWLVVDFVGFILVVPIALSSLPTIRKIRYFHLLLCFLCNVKSKRVYDLPCLADTAEFVVVATIGVSFTNFIFSASWTEYPNVPLLLFFIIPITSWMIFRFRGVGTSLFITLMATIAVWHTSQGKGPMTLIEYNPIQELLYMQSYLAIISIASNWLVTFINHREEELLLSKMIAEMSEKTKGQYVGMTKKLAFCCCCFRDTNFHYLFFFFLFKYFINLAFYYYFITQV